MCIHTLHPLPSLWWCLSQGLLAPGYDAADVHHTTAGLEGSTQPGLGRGEGQLLGSLPCPRVMPFGNMQSADAKTGSLLGPLGWESLPSDDKKGKMAFSFSFKEILCIKQKPEPQPQDISRHQEPLEYSLESSRPHLTLVTFTSKAQTAIKSRGAARCPSCWAGCQAWLPSAQSDQLETGNMSQREGHC